MYADTLLGIEKKVALLASKPAVVAAASAGAAPKVEIAATTVNATSKPVTPAVAYE